VFGFVESAPVGQYVAEVVEVGGEIRMRRGERLFVDIQRAPQQRNGLGIAALCMVKTRQVA
jgi:hypothetical protein